MHGSSSRSRKFRDRITAAFAATGVITLLAGMIVMGTATTAAADSGGGSNGDKVYVCKWTKKPAVGEAASHIVPPSSKAVKNGWFADGQSFSFVLEWTKSTAPTIADCPAYNPNMEVTPVLSADNPCGTADDKVVVKIDDLVYEVGNTTFPFTVSGSSTAGYDVTFDANPAVTYVGGPTYTLASNAFPYVACDVGDLDVSPVLSALNPCGAERDDVLVKIDNVAYEAGNVTYPFAVSGSSTTGFTVTFAEKAGVTYVEGPTYSLGSAAFPLVACSSQQDLPVTPEITYVDACGTASDTVDGVKKDGYTFVANAATGVVTFTPAAGYVLSGANTLTAPWTDKPCPTRATAVAPLVDGSDDCEVEGSYTIRSTPGVQYLLDGVAIAAGTYDGPVSGVLTAQGIGDTVLTNPDFEVALEVEEAEECPVEVLPAEGEDVCSNIAGEQSAVPAGYTKVKGKCVKAEVAGVQTERPKPTVKPIAGEKPGAGPVAVPTAVDAGFGGPAATSSQEGVLGQALMGGGVVMLLLAGSMQVGRRERGAHQA